MLNQVNSNLVIHINRIIHRRINVGCNVHLIAGSCDVEGEFSVPESPAWVLNGIIANGLELRNGKESGDHVELDQLFFLLIGEGVESASLEAGEGTVGGAKMVTPSLELLSLLLICLPT